jgi:hypothetical protein
VYSIRFRDIQVRIIMKSSKVEGIPHTTCAKWPCVPLVKPTATTSGAGTEMGRIWGELTYRVDLGGYRSGGDVEKGTNAPALGKVVRHMKTKAEREY